MSKTATDPKAEAKPAPKPATLEDTLSAIAAAAEAERQATADAYDQLVSDLAADKATLTPAGVVGVLRRANRTPEHLGEDVRLAKELIHLQAEYARWPALHAAEQAAAERVAQAAAAWEQAKAEIDRPVLAAQVAHQQAKEAATACRQLNARIVELKRQQAQRDARRTAPAAKPPLPRPHIEIGE